MEKTSYGLGRTTIDRETAEINPFPTCKRSNKSNTKGSRDTAYSKWLKQIPIDILWKLNPGVRTITLTKIANYKCKLHTKETEYGAEH